MVFTRHTPAYPMLLWIRRSCRLFWTASLQGWPRSLSRVVVLAVIPPSTRQSTARVWSATDKRAFVCRPHPVPGVRAVPRFVDGRALLCHFVVHAVAWTLADLAKPNNR